MAILVTGSSSMIGQAVLESLNKRSIESVGTIHIHSSPATHIANIDLLDWNNTFDVISEVKNRFNIEGVIHLAGENGNIQYNAKYPFDIAWKTTQIGLNIIRATVECRIPKILSVLASCSYGGEDVLEEEKLWYSPASPSVECHGISKRFLHHLSRQANKKTSTLATCAILNNSFGPGDSYNVNKTKVIGGLIVKFCEAVKNKDPDVLLWGSGAPLREFVYCKDAGEALVETYLNYNDNELPLNIGSDNECTIKELAELIADLTGFQGDIVWNTDMPDGQMRKKLDLTRMHQFIQFEQTPFTQALRETIDWYKEVYH